MFKLAHVHPAIPAPLAGSRSSHGVTSCQRLRYPHHSDLP